MHLVGKDSITITIGIIVLLAVITGVVFFSQYLSTQVNNPASTIQDTTLSGSLTSSALPTGNHTLTFEGKAEDGTIVTKEAKFTVTAPNPYKQLVIIPSAKTTAQQNEIANACKPLGNGNNVFNIKQFGAKGDGSTDDYNAIRGAAAFISQPEQAGKTLFYPSGTYKINQTIDWTKGEKSNKNIRYWGAKDIKIIGCSAIIDVKGDFRKQPYNEVGEFDGYKLYNADITQIVPFEFLNSSGFLLSGFELKGNVDKMTRDTKKDGKTISIVEQNGHGVATHTSKNYTLQNLTIHGFSTDGIMLGGGIGYVADTNAIVENVISRGNARQGMSIIQLRGGIFRNIQLLDTGRVGAYGGHYPMAGLDIEPDVTTTTHPQLTADTGDLLFENCTFANNNQSQIIASSSHNTENVTIRNSKIITDNNSSRKAIVLGIKNAVLENNDINIKHGAIWLHRSRPENPILVSATVKNNTIYSAEIGIISGGADTELLIENNTVTSDRSSAQSDKLIDLREGKVRFKNNKVVVSGPSYRSDNRNMVSLLGAIESSLNRFETNLTGPTGASFGVEYGSNTKVTNDFFAQPTFIKPSGLTTFSNPYSK